jgi:tripartite-type tricarboxylate transporter receptor subunit TctC
MKKIALAVGLATAIGLAVPPAHAQFPQKNIDFIIPFGTGGGFDRTVRLISPHLEKVLPQKVEVLPRNIPGAGGRKGMATVYRAKPDGHTIGIANVPGAAIPAVTGEKVEYDYGKYTWIARLATEDYMLAVAAKSSIKTLDDLAKLGRPIKFTSTGFGATSHAASAIISEVMGWKYQLLSGYKGTTEYIVAVVRGDGDAVVAPVATLRKYFQSGDMRPLFTTEEKSSMSGVPTIASLGHKELTGLGVHRFVVAPPGLPEPITNILSDAFLKAMADPEYVAAATKAGAPPEPLGAKQAYASALQAQELYLKYKSAVGRRE